MWYGPPGNQEIFFKILQKDGSKKYFIFAYFRLLICQKGRRSIFASEGAMKIGCVNFWAWSLKFILVLLRSQ